MKKLVFVCLLSALFLGPPALFLGCSGGNTANTGEEAFDEAEMEDPGEMDTTGGSTEPTEP